MKPAAMQVSAWLLLSILFCCWLSATKPKIPDEKSRRLALYSCVNHNMYFAGMPLPRKYKKQVYCE